VTMMVTLRAGHDVAYFTRGSCAGGCAGAMSYYTASGEPPGRWAGKGARSLGLGGEVDPAVIERLYRRASAPAVRCCCTPRLPKPVREREDAAVAAFAAEHPFASAVEIAEVRAAERAKEDAGRVPYYDLPISLVKSVSVLHASLKQAAKWTWPGRWPGCRGATNRRPNWGSAPNACANMVSACCSCRSEVHGVRSVKPSAMAAAGSEPNPRSERIWPGQRARSARCPS
jgi:hypothetical protein